MTRQYTKLKTLLQELFQLDQPDLDFGLYRIMHAKSAEVSQFLDKDFLPQVQAAFGAYRTADKAELERELARAIEQAQGLGVDPETTQKVKELRARLASEAVDVGGLEREVYDHLYTFFRRYYSEGDYLAKRVYKPGVYAIPYEGEEVTLHWANKDQYYIKTSEYLRNYAFRLRPNDPANPMRVHFRLADAAEGEHGNVKVAEGKERRFKLAAEQPLAVENGELVLRFTYLPDPKKQAELNVEAEAAVLGTTDPMFAEWVAAFKAPAPTEKDPDRTVLAKHLKGYSDRNTFDYFIHKDLGGFLRRELDFYIKNEVMHLDDVESETAPRVEQYLSKIKVIRRIAGKIIDFLAQLEDFQKKLWLKKKFVVETSYCIRLGVIPEEFFPEIASNDAQREEWVALCGVDAFERDLLVAEYSASRTEAFLKAHPSLMVDTRHFAPEFVARLLDEFDDIDEQQDGLLFHAENFQALQLASRVRVPGVCFLYADPPYNAKSSEIAYKNTFKHSSWMSMMADRLEAAFRFGGNDFLACIAIDENEQERLSALLGDLAPSHASTCVTVVHNPGGIQGDNFSYCHEYAIFLYPAKGSWIGKMKREAADVVPLRDWGGDESRRETAANCFYPIFAKDGKVTGFGPVLDDTIHPSASVVHLPDGSLELYPIDQNGVERKWRFARQSVESIMSDLVCEMVNGEYVVRRHKSVYRFKTVWSDKRYNANAHGSRLLSHILGSSPFDFPKSVYNVGDCIAAGTNNARTSTTVDPFAGSGTTGHAVINLNRDDGGRRKFILVEMGDYFDTVLLPRIKKVTFTPEWKDGRPKRLATAEEAERGPRIVKVVRLESYEDTLNNLQARRTDQQLRLLDAPEAQGADRLREEYILRYMLAVETRGSQSLLNVQGFTDPTAYRLRVKRPGSDESREMNADLLETFNWLIGLTVSHIAAPKTFAAAFKRDDDPDLPKDAPRRLLLAGRLREDAHGPWWFRAVTGTTPDGSRALVIWRKLTGDPEQDNLVLDEWFTRQGYSARDSEFDLIYVNGGNNLENLKTPDDRWKVRLIEEDFHRLMFEGTER